MADSMELRSKSKNGLISFSLSFVLETDTTVEENETSNQNELE
jgi:hypothetical protein